MRGKKEYTICSVRDCGRKHQAHSFCDMHYQRARYTGELGNAKECQIEECHKIAKYTGLCAMHYARKIRNGSPHIVYKKGRKNCLLITHKKPTRDILNELDELIRW